MSLNNLNSGSAYLYDAPRHLWKNRQKVQYRFDARGGDKKYNSQISQSESGEFITIKAQKSASFSKLPPSSSPSSCSPPSTPIVRYARTPCDSCGHHNIPIMTLPISPLAKSQTNLELMEVNNARQTLLPIGSDIHRDESSYSLAVPQTLQISRRPSVLLQEILGGRKDHGVVGGSFGRKKSCIPGQLNGTVTGSTVTIQGDNGAKSFQAKQSKVKNRRQGNDAISAALSALYCKLLVLLGVCLPITEVITEQIPTYVYQGFYVYLYALSIVFIGFLYVSAFRNRTLISALKSYRMILMRDLRYIKDTSNEHHSMELDNLLLIVAQTGVYLYGMFSILGSYFSKWDTVPDRIEGIIAEVFSIMQTSLQTMFILHSSHRRCKGSNQVRKKPGREIITFLLVANMAIWFVNTLIKGRAVFRETHMEFYGAWAWTIITHVSMPLAIFYRFHSTICLFEVWKITYKAKAH
uniref:Uncharacterized protein n=1 Tax=Stomoxys calcitrans TaxID=35570 RepID=A0A1I8PRS4_STOCA